LALGGFMGRKKNIINNLNQDLVKNLGPVKIVGIRVYPSDPDMPKNTLQMSYITEQEKGGPTGEKKGPLMMVPKYHRVDKIPYVSLEMNPTFARHQNHCLKTALGLKRHLNSLENNKKTLTESFCRKSSAFFDKENKKVISIKENKSREIVNKLLVDANINIKGNITSLLLSDDDFKKISIIKTEIDKRVEDLELWLNQIKNKKYEKMCSIYQEEMQLIDEEIEKTQFFLYSAINIANEEPYKPKKLIKK
jgi:hypothetical protein